MKCKLLATVVIMTLVITSPVTNAALEWNGTTDNLWTTGTNWVGGIAPAAGTLDDSLIFGPEIAGDHTITGVDGAYSNITTVDFSTATGGYNISGTGSFSLTSGATFGGTSGFAQTVTNLDLVSNGPGGIVFNGTDDLTIGGIISGTGGITQSGTGNVTLSGANTYSGGTTVSAGTLTGTTTSLQGNITDNAALVFDQATDGTYAGVISGTGTLTKSGTGNVTLSGANTYSGGTTVSAGTLTGTTTSLQGNITDNAALVFDQATDGTYSGVISGTGTLTKTGTGTLTLSGANTYTGLTTLSAGTLDLGGQVSGDLTVNGGLLMGTGTVAGGGTLTLNNGASFAPGNSIGTLTVSGDYVQNAGSTLEVEIFKDAGGVLSNDQVNVTGTATLAAGSTIEVTDLTPPDRFIATGDTFDIITTTGGVTDNGATITSLSASLSFTSSIVGNDFILTALRSQFGSNAVGTNNAAVLGAVDGDLGSAAGDFLTVVNELSALSAGALNNAAEELLPLPHASTAAFTTTLSTNVSASTASYLNRRRQGALHIARYGAPQGHESLLAQASGAQPRTARDVRAIRPEVSDQTKNFYVQPFGMYYEQDSTSQFTGFSASSAGMSFGIDNIVDDRWVVGVGGAYMHTWMNFDGSAGDGEIDSFRVGPYVSYFEDDFYIDAMLGFGYHLNKTERDVNFGGINRTAKADYDAYDFSAYLGTGYDFDLQHWTLTPTASLQYTNLHAQSFRESGAGAAGLDVDAYSQDSLVSRVGLRLHTLTQWDSVWVAPELFAGYAHEFMDEENMRSRLLGGTTKFTTDVDNDRKDSFYLGGALSATLTQNTSAFIRYESEFYSGNDSHAVSGGVTFLF